MSTWPCPPQKLSRSLQNLTTGFDALPSNLLASRLLSIIATIRLITIGFDMYLSHHPAAPSLVRILWARNSVQHDLLSLVPKSIAIAADGSAMYEGLYELVHLSTLAFTLLVLFPIPRVAGLHAKLSQRLMLALDNCTLQRLWEQYPDLLLWATVSGGMIAEGSLRTWFGEMTRRARPQTGWVKQAQPQGSGAAPEDLPWAVVREICSRFLWFDGAECEGEGKVFWDEACKMELAG